MADPRDDLTRRSAALDDRSVLGAAPFAGGPTMASPGAYETPGAEVPGASTGGRDYGDSGGDLRPATSHDAFSGDGMAEEGAALAHEVFGSDEDTNPEQLSEALRREEDGHGRE